jgi:hypothetical protein
LAEREAALWFAFRGDRMLVLEVRISSFSAGLVDLTNPEAWNWIKDIITEELIGNGASGWMADFGEGLPYDAVLFSGTEPKSYHHRYAEEWARVNREVISEAGRGEDIVFFNRSGYTRSPVTARCSGLVINSLTGMSMTASRAPSRVSYQAGSRATPSSTRTLAATRP